MHNELKKVMDQKLEGINVNNIFPFIRYASGDVRNYPICVRINRSLFYSNKFILLSLLSLGIKKASFIPYPKASDNQKQKKIELINKYLIKYKKYGKRDLNSLLPILQIAIKSREEMESFAKEYGLQNNERKLLGLKSLTFDKSKMKPTLGRSLFDL